MGLFGNSSSSGGAGPSSSLPPTPYPVGAIPTYCTHTNEIVLKLTEKRLSWTGDDFDVHDVAGQKIFRVEAKAVSMHDRKNFIDAKGVKLFSLVKRMIALHATYDAEGPDGSKLFTITKKLSVGKAKLECKFENRANDGRKLEMQLRGDWFDRSAEITLDGVPVARIARSFFNMREMMSDKQTYYLSVAAGVDVSMLTAIAIILDESENDQKK